MLEKTRDVTKYGIKLKNGMILDTFMSINHPTYHDAENPTILRTLYVRTRELEIMYGRGNYKNMRDKLLNNVLYKEHDNPMNYTIFNSVLTSYMDAEVYDKCKMTFDTFINLPCFISNEILHIAKHIKSTSNVNIEDLFKKLVNEKESDNNKKSKEMK